jgi:hypothetical protein
VSAPVDQELLADPAPLAAKLGIADDDPELLYAVLSASRDFVGAVRHPVKLVVDDETRLDGSGTTMLQLPCAPVVEVTTVDVDGTVLASDEFDWSEDGLLERSEVWPRRLRSVRVVYSHGYVTVPTDIADAVLQKAEMSFNVTPGLSSIIVGGETLTFATRQGASVTGVTETWTRTVEKYRLNRGDRS